MNKLFKLLILSIIPISLFGQISPVTTQYILNPLTINPAYAGARGALNVAALYRRQWIGIPGSPETMTLAGDVPLLDKKLGQGLILVNDKIGVTKDTRISTTYAYRISMDDGNLAFGLGAGIMTTNTAYSDLIAIDQGDENYMVDSKVFVVPDFSFGVYYSYKNYFAGFSIPKLLGYSFDYNKNKYSLKVSPGQYNYLLNTGYLFNVNKKVKIFPSTLISYTPGEKVLIDINAHLILYDRLWFGASYRNGRSVGGLFQFAVNNQLRLAYTYDFDIGDIGLYSNGTHEIMLRYEFKYNVDVVNPLIF